VLDVVVDPDDVRVPERRQDPGLVDELPARAEVAERRRGDAFDDDVPAQDFVHPHEHASGSAFAYETD
jgi:hypothetical protein